MGQKILLKDSKDKESHPEEREASPRAKSYLVKSRPKRDLADNVANSTATTTTTAPTTTTTTTTSTTTTAPPSSSQSCNSRRCKGTASVAKKNNERRRKPNSPPKIMRIFNTTSTNTNNTITNTNSTRQASSKSLKSSSEDPMLADGTQQAAYWDVASPYGTYNPAYKKQAVGVTAHDRHDEYEVEEDESTAPAAVPIRTARRNQTYHDTTSDEQRFFPSFPAPPSPYLNPFASNGGGFNRPPLFPGPTANRAPSRFHPQFGPKYTAPPPNRGPSSAYPAESHERYLHTNLLGSGNFEVVRGGTYYGDDDDGYHHTTGSAGHYHQDDDDGYFHHNGHSSPHGYRNNPSAGGGDFFANFRDFADINPPTRSFSHHHETVADAEPHGSASHESHEQPKNILDKLHSSSDKIEVHQPFTSSSSSSSRDLDPMMATY